MFRKAFSHLEELLIVSLMASATVLIFISVIHRYMSGLPIPFLQDWLLSLRLSWIQELSIIMFVWMAKIGAAYGVKTGIHVGVDILLNKASLKFKRFLITVGLLGGILFTSILVILGSDLVWKNGANYAFFDFFGDVPEGVYPGPLSPDLEWRTWLIYSAVPIGSAMMCFRFFEVLIAFIKTNQLPKHQEHVAGVEQVKL